MYDAVFFIAGISSIGTPKDVYKVISCAGPRGNVGFSKPAVTARDITLLARNYD